MPPTSDQLPDSGHNRDIPNPVKTLLRQLEDWSTSVSHATGPCEFGGLSEDTDGDGKRHRVSVTEDVVSVLLRAANADGRAFVALWIRRPGSTPTGRRKGWTFDLAWRGRRPDELTPKQMTATQLKAYVAPDPTAMREAA